MREIQQHLIEMYGAKVSPTLISTVTDGVMDKVMQWQSRPLDAVYPVIYLDCIHAKVRDAGSVRTKAIESVNMSLRKVSNNRGSFPNDDTVIKLFYLALSNIAKK